MKKPLPRVICVDDEPKILSAIGRSLRGALDLTMASSGAEALGLLRASPGSFQVVVSDMKMPQMDGITFLSQVRREYPDTVRILMTAFADLDAVVRAVNDGHIFRFLAKPCSTTALLETIRAGVRQNDLLSAEKVLLEQTLRGSIDALSGVLALASPTLFGRACRVKKLVDLICDEAAITDRWQIHVAAQLSQIGRITLPDPTASKLARGELLTAQEAGMVERVPEVTRGVVGQIPRLEGILEILDYTDKNFDGTGRPTDKISGEDIPLEARVLKLAGRVEELQGRGYSAARVRDTLRFETGVYDPQLLKAYAAIAELAADQSGPRGVAMHELRIGMVMAESVRSLSGVLLVAAGQEVGDGLLKRIQNYNDTVGIELPLWVKPQWTDEAADDAPESGSEFSCAVDER